MFWEEFRSDVRYAFRLARSTPLYTIVAASALALGIGANSAIFTVLHGVLLSPLPYHEPDRLVVVWSHNSKEQRSANPISPANFIDLRDGASTLQRMEAYFSFLINAPVVIDGASENAVSSYVTPGVFDLLGRRALLGRTLVPSDTRGVVVLSHGYWQRRFGGDTSVINRQILFGPDPAIIVGIMPPDFTFPYRGMLGPTGFTRAQTPDMWVPQLFEGPRIVDAQGTLVRDVHFFGAIARMKSSVTIEHVQADLATVAARLEHAYPDSNRGWSVTVVSALDQVVGPVRAALLVVFFSVALVLVMACVNVANLVLARSLSRQKELAVRAALGAGRARLVRQALTEGLLLALAGGSLGLLLVGWTVTALVALAPANVPRLGDVRPDTTVVLFTLAVSVLTGLLVGLLPAVTASRPDLRTALQDAGRGTTPSRSRRRLRASLIVGQVALAVVLTTGAGLLLRSFVTLLEVSPGFQPERLLTLQLSLPDRLTTPDARRAFYSELFARLESVPGVMAAGGTTRLPLGSTNVSASVQVDGRPVPASERPEVEFRRALHQYFRAMEIPIVRGREFGPEDGPTAPGVAVINEAMARRVFPNQDPVGQRVRIGPVQDGPWLTIVGVIGDIRHAGLELPPSPELYVSSGQSPPVAPFLVLRTSGDPAGVADLVRAEALALDRQLLIYDMRPMTDIRSGSVSERRFLLLLIGAFGVLALVMSAVGMYGVMTLVVSERAPEVGLRMALGADRGHVLRLLVGHGVLLAALGVGTGSIVARLLAPLLSSQLYGVAPTDLMTFIAVPLVLLATAAIAAAVPAARAMSIDPVSALRQA